MRSTLEKLIVDWMKRDAKVIFLAADIGGGLYKNIKLKYPDRTINVGIAEQNMIGMSAGLCTEGFRVICYSKACFISLRVLDQIKNALCYAKLPVILIASDAGFDESNAGAPHIALEDLGAINSLADINIFTPTTQKGLEKIFEKAISSELASYIRINKECISDDLCVNLNEADGFYYIRKTQIKSSRLNVVNGYIAKLAIEEAKGDIIAIDDWQCLSDGLVSIIQWYDDVVVWEEQFIDNGLYAKLCVIYVENGFVGKRLKRIGPEKKYQHKCFYREDAEKEELELYRRGEL